MPANFSAVSENEMTYVIGGGVADYLAPMMEAAQWQKFSQNMVTIVGNKYVQGFLDNTVGAMFSGTWKPGVGLAGFGTEFGKIWANNYTNTVKRFEAAGETVTGFQRFKWGVKGAGNIALNVVGNLAAIYNLGFGTVKNKAESTGLADKVL